MISKATNVKEYLAAFLCPPDVAAAASGQRQGKSVLANPWQRATHEEGIQYGMIGYYIPHSLYPPGLPLRPKTAAAPSCGSLASVKNHMALYLMCLYSDLNQANWFRAEWAKSGKKLDMGKSCVRFKKLDDLSLDVIGRAIARVPVRGLHLPVVYESILAKSVAFEVEEKP